METYLNIQDGIPSHDTIGRVFAALSSKSLLAPFAVGCRVCVPQTMNCSLMAASRCGIPFGRQGATHSLT